MTAEEALKAIVALVQAGEEAAMVPWDTAQEWPEGALELFLRERLIEPASPARSVDCRGCAENCHMPVHIRPAAHGRPARGSVFCDRTDYMGRIDIPLKRLERWQATQAQLVKLLHAALDEARVSEVQLRQVIPQLPLERILRVHDGRLEIDAHPLLQTMLPTQRHPDQKLENRLFPNGDHWSVTFDEETRALKNRVGLRYIAHLIRAQGQEVHVSDLSYAAHPAEPGSINAQLSGMTAEELGEYNLFVTGLGDAGDTLTPEAQRKIEHYLRQLSDQIEDAEETGDNEKRAILEDEREKILGQLASDRGLKGRPRKTSDPIERIRKTVTKRIQIEIARIEKSFPAFGHHLLACIKTGTYCEYTPRPKIEWKFDPI